MNRYEYRDEQEEKLLPRQQCVICKDPVVFHKQPYVSLSVVPCPKKMDAHSTNLFYHMACFIDCVGGREFKSYAMCPHIEEQLMSDEYYESKK